MSPSAQRQQEHMHRAWVPKLASRYYKWQVRAGILCLCTLQSMRKTPLCQVHSLSLSREHIG